MDPYNKKRTDLGSVVDDLLPDDVVVAQAADYVQQSVEINGDTALRLVYT